MMNKQCMMMTMSAEFLVVKVTYGYDNIVSYKIWAGYLLYLLMISLQAMCLIPGK
jgi:hypothetical protein